ncbi:hypothetical protein PENTCL1PPCAC_28053, partial [Pristionchus entomophagus]
ESAYFSQNVRRQREDHRDLPGHLPASPGRLLQVPTMRHHGSNRASFAILFLDSGNLLCRMVRVHAHLISSQSSILTTVSAIPYSSN